MRSPVPFEFMHWAKAREGTRWHLGTSGSPIPSAAEESPLLSFESGRPSSSERDFHGFPELRAAIARFHDIPEDHVLVSDGTSLANYTALSVLAGPGDRALVEAPTYPVLAEIPRFHGVLVERLDRSPEQGWLPDLQRIRDACAASGPPLRAVVLTRLHNPTGTDLPGAWLAELAQLAEAHDFHVLLDEVYLDWVDEPAGHRFSPRFLTTGSLTKVYGFGGLRIGWVLGHPDALAAAKELSFYLAVNASSPSQHIAQRVLRRREDILSRVRRRAASARAIVDAWLASRDDVSWTPPAGGLIGFLRLHRVADTDAFAARLLAEDALAVAPGEYFGCPGWIRIGFGLEDGPLSECLTRLGKALDGAK